MYGGWEEGTLGGREVREGGSLCGDGCCGGRKVARDEEREGKKKGEDRVVTRMRRDVSDVGIQGGR